MRPKRIYSNLASTFFISCILSSSTESISGSTLRIFVASWRLPKAMFALSLASSFVIWPASSSPAASDT